ncbi:MAG: replicative DNA helicase [Actinobacteria bacterium]|nr:replicative DNA helicase [Actinomycetota bacterium]
MVQAFDAQRPRPLRPVQGSPRVPPNNLEAEESLLGAMLLSADSTSMALEMLAVDDFYKPAHSHIFQAISLLHDRGEPVDAVTVTNELKSMGLFEAVGDPGLLVTLQSSTPSAAHAHYYAEIVEKHATLRRLLVATGEIADDAYGVPEDVAAVVDDAERKILAVAERKGMVDLPVVGTLFTATVAAIVEVNEHRGQPRGLTTGFHDLDDILAGLQPTSLTIVGARPGMGKTSFALSILTHVGAKLDRPALIFSLEMGSLELTQRLLASEARIDSQRMRKGTMADADFTKMHEGIGRLESKPIFIDDNARVTVMDIRARARRLKKLHGDLGVIIIDYLQLMTGNSRSENRQTEVAEISRGLKVLAKELDTPVIALSQLSRRVEERTDKRPMLADLRESGSLEQDADVVMFLHRTLPTDPGASVEDLGTADVTVAKHRSGPVGHIKLAFLDQYTRFENISRRTEI